MSGFPSLSEGRRAGMCSGPPVRCVTAALPGLQRPRPRTPGGPGRGCASFPSSPRSCFRRGLAGLPRPGARGRQARIPGGERAPCLLPRAPRRQRFRVGRHYPQHVGIGAPRAVAPPPPPWVPGTPAAPTRLPAPGRRVRGGGAQIALPGASLPAELPLLPGSWPRDARAEDKEPQEN